MCSCVHTFSPCVCTCTICLYSVDEYHYHSMSLENLNYDLCESCFQSVEETEKDNYLPTKLNPWTQYAQVSDHVISPARSHINATSR